MDGSGRYRRAQGGGGNQQGMKGGGGLPLLGLVGAVGSGMAVLDSIITPHSSCPSLSSVSSILPPRRRASPLPSAISPRVRGAPGAVPAAEGRGAEEGPRGGDGPAAAAADGAAATLAGEARGAWRGE
ncbi:unnamed protein product [Closterium sp. NIES-65]|nr:unnamed protein product [Closterium sp. NIES-65]